MGDGIGIIPFRWNLARREQLGSLGLRPPEEPYDGFIGDLRMAAAKVLARSGNSDLVFVGRSGETILDYLSGAFHEVPRGRALTLLQFSSPAATPEELVRDHRREMAALYGYFVQEGLNPAAIARRPRPVRFVDVVHSGQTFGNLVAFLRYWSNTERADWNVVRRRIGFTGLTIRTKNSPNTRRWWQHQEWVGEVRKRNINSISVSTWFWNWIAARMAKVTPSYRLNRWAQDDAERPSHDEERLKALSLALYLFDLGRGGEERERLAAEVARQPEMKEAWLRAAVHDLRRGAK